MLNFLLGQQSSNMKYPCFICLWDTRARNNPWVKKGWPPRDFMRVGKPNVINKPLFAKKKMIIPPMHIKFGLIKQLMNALPITGDCFNYVYLQSIFCFNYGKAESRHFRSPLNSKTSKRSTFVQSMTDAEAAA